MFQQSQVQKYLVSTWNQSCAWASSKNIAWLLVWYWYPNYSYYNRTRPTGLPFVVFNFPSLCTILTFLPRLKLRDCKKGHFLPSFWNLDNCYRVFRKTKADFHYGCDKFCQKSVNFQQAWPKLMQKVYYQTLNMRSVMILPVLESHW